MTPAPINQPSNQFSKQEKKRTFVVWIYTVMVVGGIIFNVLGSIAIISQSEGYGQPAVSVVYLIAALLSILLSVPTAVFIYYFFILSRKCLTWLYISFGLGIILEVLTASFIMAVLMAVFAWVVWDYIVHKNVNGSALFT
jgi:hypothetical protein